jgi:hypothetical protein
MPDFISDEDMATLPDGSRGFYDRSQFEVKDNDASGTKRYLFNELDDSGNIRGSRFLDPNGKFVDVTKGDAVDDFLSDPDTYDPKNPSGFEPKIFDVLQSFRGNPDGLRQYLLQHPEFSIYKQDTVPQSSWLDKLATGAETGARAVGAGFMGLAHGIGSGVEAAGDAIQGLDSLSRHEGGTPLGQLGRGLSSVGRDTREGAQYFEDQLRPDDMQPGSAQSIGYNAISGITQAAPILITTGPLAGALYLGGMSGANKYTELKDRGVSQPEAAMYGAGVGVADTALNAVPMGVYGKEGMPLLRRLMLGMATDAGTSAASTALNTEATKLATGDEWTPQDTAAIGESAISNALTGAGLSTIGHLKDSSRQRKLEEWKAKTMAALEAERGNPDSEILALPPPDQGSGPGAGGGGEPVARAPDEVLSAERPPERAMDKLPVMKDRLRENLENTGRSFDWLKPKETLGLDDFQPVVDVTREQTLPPPETTNESEVPAHSIEAYKQYLARIKPKQIEGPIKGDIPAPVEPETAQTLSDIPAPTEQAPLLEPSEPTSQVANLEPVKVKVKDLTLSTDVPQWKSNANEKGIVEPLKGEFDPRGMGPIQVWERNDGRLEVISGRHRFDLAQRKGVDELPAQVYREADGFTQRDAAILDAELNIKDEKGEIPDYANYFKNSGISEEEAVSRGLLSRNKGVLGFEIGTKSTPDLYSLYQDGKLTDRQAAAIARTAPGNDALQQVGIKAALKGAPIEQAVNQMRALEGEYGSLPPSEQQSLFGSDDRAIRLAEAQAKIVTKMQKEIAADIESARGSAKRPENAKKMGVKVDDVASTKKKLEALEAEKERLDRWYMDDELKAKIKAQASEEARPIAREFKKRQAALNSESGAFNIGTLLGLKGEGSDIPIEKLPESQQFFEGRIGGTHVPGLSQGLAALRSLTYDKTQADKFPHVKDAYYKGGRTLIEDANETASYLADAYRDYFRLKNPERVNSILAALREDAIKSKKAGKKILDPNDAQLAKQGLTPEEISAIRSYRKGTDLSLNYLREALLTDAEKVQGPELRKKYTEDVEKFVESLRNTNYTPFRRYGDAYQVVAKDEEGNTIWRSHHDSKAEARKVAAERIKLGEKATIAERPKGHPDAYSSYDLPADLIDRVNQFSPDTWLQAGDLQKFKPDKGPPMGFNKHLQHAEGIAGYDRNITKATADYVMGLANFKAKNKAIPEIQKVINSLDPKAEPILRGRLEKYKNDITKGTHPLTSLAKRTANVINLAGVPSSAFINATQSIVTTEPHIIGELKGSLGGRRAVLEGRRVMGNAQKAAFEFLSDRVTGKNKLASRDAALAKDIDTAMRRGIIDAEGMNELYDIKKRIDGKSGLSDKAMFMFGAAEKANRLYAFIAGREVGMRKGLEGDALFDYAKKFVLDTQFDTSKVNQNWLTRSAIGSVATQYKGFAANYIRFLRNSFKPGNRVGFGLSLAVTAGLGGAMGLPYAKQVESIAESMGLNPRKEWVQFTKNQDWAHAVLYGLPTLGGTNFSGFVSTGEFLPGIDMDPKMAALQAVGGPIAGYLGKIPKAYDLYHKKEAPWLAAETMAPRGIRGPLKAARIIKEGALNDETGQPIIEKPTTGEIAQIAMGFSPDRLGRAYEKKAFEYDEKQKTATNDKDYNMLLAKYIRAGDEVNQGRILSEMLAQGIKPNMASMKPYLADPDTATLMRANKKARPGLLNIQELMKSR